MVGCACVRVLLRGPSGGSRVLRTPTNDDEYTKSRIYRYRTLFKHRSSGYSCDVEGRIHEIWVSPCSIHLHMQNRVRDYAQDTIDSCCDTNERDRCRYAIVLSFARSHSGKSLLSTGLPFGYRKPTTRPIWCAITVRLKPRRNITAMTADAWSPRVYANRQWDIERERWNVVADGHWTGVDPQVILLCLVYRVE